jgi:hypothetical protein
MRLFFLFCFLFCCEVAQAQLKQIPFARQSASSQLNQSIQTPSPSLKPMQLPFWDDFSFNNSSKGHVYDSLWQFGHSVWVNTGMGINPPSINVATFDGLDSVGTPYNVNVVLAKGIADKLVSRPIQMDLVPAANQDSVFISFFYQYQGNGEPPDPGDEFSLWFKKKDSTWIQVWAVQYDTLKDKTKFYPVKIFVKDTCAKCFYDNFQFRFQNFARLSGPFDTWNLDYVYVSNGIVLNDTTRIPDRTIVSPPISLLKQYQSIPVKHLLSKGDTAFNQMTIPVTNLRMDQNFIGQPVSLDSYLTTTTRLNGNVSPPSTSYYEGITSAKASGVGVVYGGNTIYYFDSIPNLKNIGSNVDSIALTFKIALTTGDNVDKSFGGDYNPLIYNGIDFRVNDTIQTTFTFSNYYAYDDGEAEYAATLTNSGNYLAYQFDMMYLQPDTLVAVDIYFPHVGDETNQVLQLIVFDNQILDASNNSPAILTQQDLVVQRTKNNSFTRFPLQEAVVVTKKFFIGYKQNSSATIGVGLDKDSNSGGKIFTNLGVGWAPADLQGNLMIRPVFGNADKAKGPLTGIEERKITLYPNPNYGIFYLSQSIQNLQMMDVAGRPVLFLQEDLYESTLITLRNASPGIYLARYYNGKQWQTEKIMVLP